MSQEEPAGEGEAFGPYRLRALLGRGGMGEVWLARHTVLEREVALKRISGGPSQDEELQRRFRREARLAAKVSSAHVVPIHDFGEIDGRLFLDMRLVRGPDLRVVLDKHPEGLPPEIASDVVTQLADALDAAHELDLVHRDVKPSNVLVDQARGRWFCYLADFGVAVPAVGVDTRITSTGATIGTPAYMAPELLNEEAHPGVASDVYALGCLLYELLTGRTPFPGTNHAAVLYQHSHADPPRPSDHDPRLAGFDPVVRTAMAKAPAQRFRTAGDLARALPQRAPAPPPPPHQYSRPYPPQNTPYPPSDTRYPTPPPFDRFPTPPPPPQSPQSTRPPRRAGRTALIAIVAVLALAVAGVVAYAVTRPSGGGTGISQIDVPQVATARLLRGFSATYGTAAAPSGDGTYATAEDPEGLSLYGLTDTGVVRSRIQINGRSNRVTVNRDDTRAYVTVPGTDTSPGTSVQVVDLVAGRAVADVPVTTRPVFAVLSPDGSRLYVTTQSPAAGKPGAVVVIDTTRNTVVSSIAVGASPGGIVVSPDGRDVYVANGFQAADPDSVSVIDATSLTVVRSVPAGPDPYAMALTADGRTLYVTTNTNTETGTVDVFDTGTFARTTLPAPGTSYTAGVALTPDGKRLLITNRGIDGKVGQTVTVLGVGGGTSLPTVTLGDFPRDISVSPDGRRAYVVTEGPKGGVFLVDLPPSP